jgi:hypothetical protein
VVWSLCRSPLDHGFHRCDLLWEAANEETRVRHFFRLVAIRTLRFATR